MINREVTIVETYCSNNHSNVQQKCYVVLIVTAGEQERERERITRTVRIYKIIKLCETCASCQLANNSSVLLFDFLRAAIQLSFAKLPALFKTQSLCKVKLPSPPHRCLHINYSMHCTALLIIYCCIMFNLYLHDHLSSTNCRTLAGSQFGGSQFGGSPYHLTQTYTLNGLYTVI